MIPLITTVNAKNQEIGAIVYTNPTPSNPWVFLSAGVQVPVNIPPSAKFVRFAYDQSGGNVYSSYEDIIFPTLGLIVDSAAETNAIVRDISDFQNKGFFIINLLSDVDTKVHLYFYNS